MPEESEAEYMLPESDVRAMVRLLAEVAVTPGGVMEQKRRLVEGIAELTGADLWLWNVTRFEVGKAPAAISIMHNLSEQQITTLAHESYSNPDDEYHIRANLLCESRDHWTRTVRRVMRPFECDASVIYQKFSKAIDCSESMLTAYPIPKHPGVFSCTGLHRCKGRGPFTMRETRILHILTGEVGWLHEMGMPGTDGQEVSVMRPRLQTVLALLMDGQPPKRIAVHLDLSVHTVRGYIKEIYRHFGVGSRAELLRRFMVGDGGDMA